MAKQESVKVKMLRATRVKGEGFAVGAVVEVDAATAAMLIGYQKAVKVEGKADSLEAKSEFKPEAKVLKK